VTVTVIYTSIYNIRMLYIITRETLRKWGGAEISQALVRAAQGTPAVLMLLPFFGTADGAGC
jgi:hypothetical protein